MLRVTGAEVRGVTGVGEVPVTDVGGAELAAVADVGTRVFGGVVAHRTDADVITLVSGVAVAWDQRGPQQQVRACANGWRAQWQHPV